MPKVKLPSGREVEARIPKVKDVKLVSNIENDVDREFALMGNLCSMSPEELDDMEYKDYQALQKQVLL